jgi:hypothetical protein
MTGLAIAVVDYIADLCYLAFNKWNPIQHSCKKIATKLCVDCWTSYMEQKEIILYNGWEQYYLIHKKYI